MSTSQLVEAARSNPELLAKAEENLQTVLSRSATDPEYRQRLLSDPRSAVSEVIGGPVPESFNVVFIENKAAATFVLPDAVDPNAELSEAQLETVAGGWVGIAIALFGAFIAGATSPD